MASLPSAKSSKIKLFVNAVRHRLDRTPDAVSSPRYHAQAGLNTPPNASSLPVQLTSLTSNHIPTANVVKEASSVAWSGFKTGLKVLEKSADTFPPLKSAIGVLLACIDVVETVAGNRDDYEEISTELKTMEDTLKRVSELASDERGGSITCILKLIEAEAIHIGKQQAHCTGRRILESLQDKEDVLKRYRRIESLFRRLHNNISLRTWDTTRKTHETTLLQGIPSVNEAVYNSSYSTTIKRRACTPETREKTQQGLEDWVRDPDSAKVYWMNGMAGTGKTTILYSLCKWLEDNRQLGGNFFCSRISDPCRNVNNILPTLAYQLARYSSSFRMALCKVLDEEPGAGKRDVRHQFKKLILEPMKEVEDAMPEGVVVVVDALDECDDRSVVRLLLELMLDNAGNLPIKFIVTSRPEPVIRNQMLERGFKPSVLYLHNIEESIVEADIKTYLTVELNDMRPQPTSNQIEQLAKRAGKLFIYAATAVRYICPDGIAGGDSDDRLRTVLETVSSSGSRKQYEELDILYRSILSAAFNDKLEDQEMRRIHLVLRTAICAKEPMSVQTLASLLGLEERRVLRSLEPLQSVLHVQEGESLVSALHASFPDFMFDNRRSAKFYCERNQHSEILANGCLDLMTSQLRFNICDLESSFVYDKDIANLNVRVKKNITQGLSYSCRYWGEHLREGEFKDALHEKLVDFLTLQLLFWMEVLNLKGWIGMGDKILRQALDWLESSRTDTQKQITDAKAFVMRYMAGACTYSTPHIYISALPFCPRSSSVYHNYWTRTKGLIDVKGSATDKWSNVLIAAWRTNAPILSIAFSPDGSRIVSGSSDSTVQVWDANSGDTVAGPLQGHTAAVYSVAFSPDSKCVVSGSGDYTIQIWNARSGDNISGPFQGHTKAVNSVAFSPDGTRVVSGSGDHTIRVWDVHSGDTVAGPFQGHTQMVTSVAYSPDGTRIVTGSYDHTVRVWNAHSGETITGPFQGHANVVYSVAFSPDGTRVVSGSGDHTIRVWDAYSGNTAAEPFQGHMDAVSSVAFSPDGSCIVSGSADQTIRVWDSCSGNTIAGPLQGHINAISSVAFSPDGTCIVSSSYGQTIRVWDARSGNAVAGPSKGHMDAVTSVAFSLDGTRIVSYSQDQSIRVWDAHSGDIAAGPFQGHMDTVSSVAFSPDGSCIVSGSDDHTIRVWDSRSGDMIGGPIRGHTAAVYSVAFSSDGKHIVSGSEDHTIRVWDARSFITVAGPFQGHTDAVLSVAFSPDGTQIVSGSSDQTIRIWDAYSGDPIAGPFQGHTDQVLSVAFSPDGTHVVSGSVDQTIRVWDARRGNAVAGPFPEHTSLVKSVTFYLDRTRSVSGSHDFALGMSDTADAKFRFTDISLSPNHLHGTSSFVEYFTPNDNGWLTSNDIPLFWVSPHFQAQMPHPRNTLVIGPHGTTFVDFHNLNIGDTWYQCFH